MSDEKKHDALCRVNRGGETCNCRASFVSDEKTGWMWQRIPAGVYGLSDKRGRRLMHVTPAATIEFASPGIAALIADAPAILELLRRADSDGETDVAWWRDVRVLLDKHRRSP